VPTLETPMSPGGSQASAGEGLSPCNIGIGWYWLTACQASGQQGVAISYSKDLLYHIWTVPGRWASAAQCV